MVTPQKLVEELATESSRTEDVLTVIKRHCMKTKPVSNTKNSLLSKSSHLCPLEIEVGVFETDFGKLIRSRNTLQSF